MAIVVIIKSFEGLSGCGKGDRFVKIDFRGVSHYSRALRDTEELAEVNQSFTWNFGTTVQEAESLQLAVVARNVLRNEKVIARYGLVLQSVVRDGRVSITDALVDLNNKPLEAVVSFEIRYEPPDGSCSSYAATEMLQDERQMLIDIEENIANLERSLANQEEKQSRSRNRSPTGDSDVKSWSRIKNLVRQKQREHHRRVSTNAASRSASKPSNRNVETDAATPERKSSSLAFKTVKSLMRLGKERPSRARSCESSDCSETRRLVDTSCERATSSNASRTGSIASLDSDLSSGDNDISQLEDDRVDGIHRDLAEADFIGDDRTVNRSEALDRKNAPKHSSCTKTHPDEKMPVRSTDFSLKAQHYQVCITIIEARQLAGLNMDPVVCVQIEDQRKYTSVKESTNCPYYNEYFVFDFHMPPVMLLDKIITLSVQQSRNILRANLTLGTFKLDIATVWAQSDHQFYHKWALLTDPDDVAGGPKGYLKCDISVIGKGDSVKIPIKGAERDEDDIEGNLLLPGGAPIERQRARYIVKVFRADGLPKMNSSVMANVKKAFTGQLKDLVDPYVRISFAGLTGKTSVKRNSYAPVWNEQVIFTEMFPPLCQRIKIQLCDDDPVNGSVIGTHFIDLKEISNDGDKGFLPTFGPAFVHLYGSTRDYTLVDRHSTLNTGLGEGISYRARLLVAIRTEMSDNADSVGGAVTTSDVEVMQTIPANETAYATNEEFFLFATIMDATMIDKKLGEKPMYFEISIGNAGNILDGHNESSKETRGIETPGVSRGCSGIATEASSSSLVADTPIADHDSARRHLIRDGGESWQSTTNPAKPMTHDRLHYFLPYWDDKPCLRVRSVWPDYRRRMYNSNMIGKIVDKLEEGLADVHAHEQDPKVDKIFKNAMEELSIGCNRYVTLSRSSSTGGPELGKTKLDRERIKLCQRELENIGLVARNLKATVTRNTFKERTKTARTCLEKLKFLLEDPQQSLPDVFVWVISSGRRVAYHRLSARDIIYSIVDEESGRYCATVQNMFLKLPGKKGFGTSGWTVQAKIQIYMWLGILKHKKYLIQGLPKGYEMSNELKNIERPRALAPSTIHYVEKHKFQLRAHMYQARSLIGSDASGLSDPFARVICGEFSKTTQVIDETLSPTWDELVLIDNIIIYGTSCVIKKQPPTVVIELFDRDKVGKSEYIGRTLARARVKLRTEVYGPPEFPPSLEWYRITRGSEPAGELLAVFELIEYPMPGDKQEMEPKLPDAKYYQDYEVPSSGRSAGNIGANGIDQGPVFPVPFGIRPTLSRYRIEVLFWGLRDLKRIHLMSVDKPRVDVECAGHILHSSVITNAKKNPNFSIPIKFIDLELPDRELYRPPVTIRALDCRSFGRYTLVGTHTISSIQKYMDNEIVMASSSSSSSRSRPCGSAVTIACGGDPDDYFGVESTVVISLGLGNYSLAGIDSKKEKMRLNLRRKESLSINGDGTGDSDIEENGSRDWWTKYFASLEAIAVAAATESNVVQRNVKGLSEIDPDDLAHCPATWKVANPEMDHGQRETIGVPSERSVGQAEATKRSRLFGLNPLNGNAAGKIVAKLSPKNVGNKSGAAAAAAVAAPGSENAKRNVALMKIYDRELEGQTEFNEFREWLDTFELYRGKKTGDDVEDASRIVGSFKGGLKMYKWPSGGGAASPRKTARGSYANSFQGEERFSWVGMTSFDPQIGFFQSLPIPSNEPIHVLVRVYIVRGNDLHPCDPNGKADPYVVLHLGEKRISDKDNYISKQLNPVFGKCFEVEATFPQDSLLTVQVLDWDLVGSDDIIGETRIDLENRFYSKHRATCGIARRYDESGYNKWRDPMKPSQILSKLCKEAKLEPPTYSHGRVTVGDRTFTLSNEEMRYYVETKGIEEHLALEVLHRWGTLPRVGTCLIPEHVESRSLYKPEKPGIEQGKLDMWVDMFPMDMPLPGPPIDISPRKPKSYELRVIIWNTEDVVLEDDAFFTGEKMSDIYVKGWLKGSEDCQSTDIHYRSLTGEGNFNWRFIFPFDYLVAEERIVMTRKESLFSWDESEFKIPARLELQVWDADHFSADDFLGAITLDLNRFPRGAKSSKLCTLGMLKTDGSVPAINIFKQKRVKGWWPFYVKKENEDMELTGKVEAEIHLVTKDEAESNPAGHGRSEPDPLDKPSRPDASFVWLLNPIKSIKYIIWHNYKWAILKATLVVALAFLLILFFYAIPGYSVKKMLGAR